MLRRAVTPEDFEPDAAFFERLDPLPGPKVERCLTIGPFSVRLAGLTASVVPAFEDRYMGFVDPAPAAEALRLALHTAGREQFLASVGDERGWYQLRARLQDGRAILYAHDFAGWFGTGGGKGELALCRPGWEGLQLPLENLLRAYYAWRAVDHQGFLVHAASVVCEGRAYVFFGHSEAGKTEVAELSRDRGEILSDDLTLLTLEPGGYVAHSVPFRGRFRERIVTVRKAYPVAGLFHLVRAERNRAAPLPRVRAAADLFSCLPFITDRLAARDPAEVMTVCERALRTVPVFQLEYTPTRELWEPVLSSVR
jgi:hypothetical protein